jgi:signal transduction histidine kinase
MAFVFSSKPSLTRTTLIKMGIRVTLIIIAVTAVSYWHLVSILESQTLEQLEKDIVERGQRESQLFMLAEDNHAVFKKEFLWQLEKWGDSNPQSEFEQLFVRWEDDTIRNRPKNFDGTRQPGIFIGKINEKKLSVDADIRRRVLTTYHLLMRYGPAWHNRFQNTYVTMPENIAGIYWPDGPTWAIDVASDYYILEEEYFWIAEPSFNPTRKTAWTGVFVDDVTKVWMVSGETPIYLGNQHIATVGHDIILNELLTRTIDEHIEGAYNIIFREDGRLIAHPDYMAQILAADGKFNILTSTDQHLLNIFQTVKHRQPGTIALENTKNNEYLAVTKIAGPDWYFVTVYPKSLLAHLAFDTARFILILGLISLLIEITLLFLVLRQQVAQPLNDLIGATEQVAVGSFKNKLDINRQDELGQLAQSFNAMSVEIQAREESLRKANQLKDEFLANTSHELRTPLNGIIGIAESLREGVAGDLSDTAITNLSMIVSSGKRLSALVSDILDFSKLKHKEIELQQKSVGLRELVEVVLTLSQPMIGKKTVQLVNTIESNLPLAYADENRLKPILYNLVGNAIKFTESGQIEVSANVVENLDGFEQSQGLVVTISDTSIGIPENQLGRVFESFEQVEGGTAREYGGTGLGLAVTKQLVQLQAGTIWVESTPGVGSRFTFSLPISEEASASQLSVSREPLVQILTATQVESLVRQPPVSDRVSAPGQYRILIVDDEPVNRQVVANFLSLQDYNIIQATSGMEAITLIEKGLMPDAILLDVMMPRMTGYE